MTYVTYSHKKPNGSIFYIGKGTIKRAYSKSGRNIVWKRTVEKYKSFEVDILAHWDTEKEAFQHEIVLIDSLKAIGMKLVNIAKGGMGSSGHRHTKEHKEKMSNFMKKNNPMDNNETRKKQIENLKTAMNRSETKKNQSNARLGMKFSDSHVESLKKCHPTKSCVINKITYPSLCEASRQLGIRHGTLHRWLNNPNVIHNKKYVHITECRWLNA